MPVKENPMDPLTARMKRAWEGRVSGCMLGKAVELYSMTQGQALLTAYLTKADALPLRDYIPLIPDAPDALLKPACRGHFDKSAPDDDINYSVLALEMLETHGRELQTTDVARTWLNRLPIGMTFTAERAAYRKLAMDGAEWFALGAPLGFDVTDCADNPHNEWIGAQIRADVYGWVAPGQPDLAAKLARVDAELSHRGNGVYGAVIVAAWGASIPTHSTLEAALDAALEFIPKDSGAAEAVALGRRLAKAGEGTQAIIDAYGELSPVHTLNNLALVVWALLRAPDDFGAAIGDVVAAGWDTDCNGATVGALWALQDKAIPEAWTRPWNGCIGVSLAGREAADLDDLAERTAEVARCIE
jgi:ADP-ribosylglycohydrolase